MGAVAGLDVDCPPSLLIGEVAPCLAVALLSPRGDRLVSPLAMWSSTAGDVVAVDSIGTVTGRSAGHATVSASYEGRGDAAPVTVIAVDALRIRSALDQGSFTPRSLVTMYLQGYYSVASEETGRLRLQISDQNGPLGGTLPQTVARGGDYFNLSATFIIPEDSIEVCRTAILEVGSIRIAEPMSNASGLWCLPVRR